MRNWRVQIKVEAKPLTNGEWEKGKARIQSRIIDTDDPSITAARQQYPQNPAPLFCAYMERYGHGMKGRKALMLVGGCERESFPALSVFFEAYAWLDLYGDGATVESAVQLALKETR